MTLPEKRLWAQLRKLDLNIRRQTPIGRYIADFACHSARLVIEVDSGRHELEAAQLYDHERSQWLETQGYHVIRFQNDEVLGDAWSVAERISDEIRRRKALPLDGGGLGGGAGAEMMREAQKGADAMLLTNLGAVHSPPSPTLPPSRGKGE